ncbi:hypothetical protein CC85DRAFT_240963 [Cutaneotrichosporon oleaginosum]|uniref:DUF336-domain-containing protein n=1 Tax=Cutaneotrichosporon oleaginosum TaxID=879819 RepID=A0A0J0XVT5_9TREE|nr:uncharacterized protein CC85DRAFT_240963 [Cutaneotrichosporon oleaginosum]KLT45205.1 hypothetical protein CC85DRAFT_240963 [Cutaneotrichosporon oleaginosum]TXT14959.1 hypothetical protein COLE_01152 [Cutaneotrichosporon oleaginosum]
MAAASAEIASLVAKQEAQLRFVKFDADVAWRVGTSVRDTFLAARETGVHPSNAGIVVHIETFTGHTLFSCAVGSAPAVGPDNWLWVRGKLNVVKRFNVSSLRKGREIAAKGQTPEEKGLHFPEYACHGGAFPIWIAGCDAAPVGAIVVSGLPQLDDHQLIVDSLAQAQDLFTSA